MRAGGGPPAGRRGRCHRVPAKGNVYRGFSSGARLSSAMGPLPRTVELFYDVLSPYSWLGFEVTPGLGRRGPRAGRAQDAGPCLGQLLALPEEFRTRR